MRAVVSILAIFFIFAADVVDVCAYTIRITCRAKGREKELCEEALKEWVEQFGGEHTVDIVTLPHASNECFALYQQWLSAESFDIDILQMDVAWVGVFSDYLESLDQYYKDDPIETDNYFDAIKANMYKDGKLLALPWYTDCGVIYYRKDLLEKYNKPIPSTWEELYETALYIQKQERKKPEIGGKFFGFIFQAKAFEILTCNFIEFIDSFGGKILQNGKVTIDSDKCIDATMFMVKSMENINSRGALNYSEEDARGVFQSGNAAFMRSWPYAWALMNEPSTAVSGKIGVMPIPPSANGGKSSGVLGGWFLGVSKYSKNKALAADLIKFLTSKIQQKKRAKYSYLPTFKDLYTDIEVLEKNAFFETLYQSLDNAVARPSIEFGKSYPRVSAEIYNTLNTILTQSLEDGKNTRKDVAYAISKLFKNLEKILRKNADRTNQKEKKLALLQRFRAYLGSLFSLTDDDTQKISNAKATTQMTNNRSTKRGS